MRKAYGLELKQISPLIQQSNIIENQKQVYKITILFGKTNKQAIYQGMKKKVQPQINIINLLDPITLNPNYDSYKNATLGLSRGIPTGKSAKPKYSPNPHLPANSEQKQKQDSDHLFFNKRPLFIDESRISAIKVYENEDNEFITKDPQILTFGPINFQLIKKDSKVENIDENILPVTHKNSPPVSASPTKSDRQNELSGKIKKNILVLQKQRGYSRHKIQNMKEDTLNYELYKLSRNKGLEYLKENREKYGRLLTEQPIKLKLEQVEKSRKIERLSNKGTKVNTVPPISQYEVEKEKKREFLPEISRKNSKKTVKSEGKPLPKKQETLRKGKSAVNIKKKVRKEDKLKQLNNEQEKLGSIVYDQVQNFFRKDHEKLTYDQKIRSMKKIDDTWLQYLKVKMDRAQLILNK